MEAQPDFRELLESFNARGVEYLIVGGYALAFHGAPRFTGDLDLFLRPSKDNAARVLDSLRDFGFGSLDLSEDDFSRPDQVIQLGMPPVRIDLLTSLTGLDWERARAGCVNGFYADVPVPYLGRAELVLNKRAAGRARDLADLEALGDD